MLAEPDSIFNSFHMGWRGVTHSYYSSFPSLVPLRPQGNPPFPLALVHLWLQLASSCREVARRSSIKPDVTSCSIWLAGGSLIENIFMVFAKKAWRQGGDLILTFHPPPNSPAYQNVFSGKKKGQRCHHLLSGRTGKPGKPSQRSAAKRLRSLKIFTLCNHTGEGLRQTCRHPALPLAACSALTLACTGSKNTISCAPERRRNSPSPCRCQARLEWIAGWIIQRGANAHLIPHLLRVASRQRTCFCLSDGKRSFFNYKRETRSFEPSDQEKAVKAPPLSRCESAQRPLDLTLLLLPFHLSSLLHLVIGNGHFFKSWISKKKKKEVTSVQINRLPSVSHWWDQQQEVDMFVYHRPRWQCIHSSVFLISGQEAPTLVLTMRRASTAPIVRYQGCVLMKLLFQCKLWDTCPGARSTPFPSALLPNSCLCLWLWAGKPLKDPTIPCVGDRMSWVGHWYRLTVATIEAENLVP